MNNIKQWKRWSPSLLTKANIQPSNTVEIDQLIDSIKISSALNAKQDKRICVFCNGVGDMKTNGSGRYSKSKEDFLKENILS